MLLRFAPGLRWQRCHPAIYPEDDPSGSLNTLLRKGSEREWLVVDECALISSRCADSTTSYDTGQESRFGEEAFCDVSEAA
jgi:hypothetical protein